MKGLRRLKVWQLILLLILVVGASTGLIVGASMVGRDNRTVIGEKYRCESEVCEFIDIDEMEYNELVAGGESFVIFVDQEGCSAANTLREIVRKYMNEHNIRICRIWFDKMKKTVLSNKIKYYPSAAIIKDGELKKWLDAGSEKDADVYNNYEAFSGWVGDLVIL